MDIRSKQDEDEDKDIEMTLDSKTSTPDPPNNTDISNTATVINSDDERETT